MHILFLTDNFYPETNAPASRTFEHAQEWIKKGHKVTIITTAPNFPKGIIYDGYKNKIFQKEIIEGIDVLRVWSFITSNEGFFLRILDYVSFMFSSIVGSFFISKTDIVVGTSPQFFTVCGAYIVSILKRKPFVFELRDLWPESIITVGAMKNKFLIKLIERVEIYLYTNADAIISVTNSFKKVLIKRGINPKKIFVITNGVIVEKFIKNTNVSSLKKKLNLNNYIVGGYIGTHGLAHKLETILNTAKMLQDKKIYKFKFLFLGDGANKKYLLSYSKKLNLNNVIFLESVSKKDVIKYWSLLDFSIIHLQNKPLFKFVIPSKIFESMSMKVPIILGVLGEASNIITSEKVGTVFEPENSIQLYKAIIKFTKKDNRNTYIKNCRNSAAKYNRKNLANEMLKILKNLKTK